mgnify:FL=1
MLKFYDVDISYANYLRNFDYRVPQIKYNTYNKFVCGVVLKIDKYDYFVPISSNISKHKTSILIEDDNGRVIASIKFCFMFPVPPNLIKIKDFARIKQVDPTYVDLLVKELNFCQKNENKIIQKALRIYKIGCNKKHILNYSCCDFLLLQQKYDEWVNSNVVAV